MTKSTGSMCAAWKTVRQWAQLELTWAITYQTERGRGIVSTWSALRESLRKKLASKDELAPMRKPYCGVICEILAVPSGVQVINPDGRSWPFSIDLFRILNDATFGQNDILLIARSSSRVDGIRADDGIESSKVITAAANHYNDSQRLIATKLGKTGGILGPGPMFIPDKHTVRWRDTVYH